MKRILGPNHVGKVRNEADGEKTILDRRQQLETMRPVEGKELSATISEMLAPRPNREAPGKNTIKRRHTLQRGPNMFPPWHLPLPHCDQSRGPP